jgi:polyisoprenoid-binding protein YceI
MHRLKKTKSLAVISLLGAVITAVGLLVSPGVKSQTQTGAQAARESANKPAFVSIPGGSYAIDPAHSSIGFTVRHLMLNNVRGRFTDFAGTIIHDDKDITKSSVEFTAKVASINTDVARRDEHLRAPDFFDAVKYPELTFKSKRIERRNKNSYVAIGDFTLRGVTKEIAIPFTLNGALKEARGGGYRIGVEAATVINRQDYGVSWSRALDGGGLAVANEVNVELMLEAVMRAPEKPGTAPGSSR